MTFASRTSAVRWTGAVITFACAAFDLIFGPGRLEYPAPVRVLHAASLLDTLILAVTFYCAVGLIRGRKVALAASLVILLISAVWMSIESRHVLSVRSLVPLAGAVFLLAGRAEYRVPVNRSLHRRSSIRTFAIVGTLTLFGIVLTLTDVLLHHAPLSFPTVVIRPLERMYDFTGLRLHAGLETFVQNLLLSGIGIFNYCLIAYTLLRPISDYYHHTDRAARRVADLLESYGDSSEDNFKLFPADKSYYFGRAVEGFIAYGEVEGCCIALADPIAPDRPAKEGLLREFIGHCRQRGWYPVVIGVGDAGRPLYETNGLSLVKIGESAIVDLTSQPEGKQGKDRRNIMNRFRKNGYAAGLSVL